MAIIRLRNARNLFEVDPVRSLNSVQSPIQSSIRASKEPASILMIIRPQTNGLKRKTLKNEFPE